ncbi:sensor histidine kinase [Rhizobium sp. SSA_523]|uniref:sensor histidine kinase n=1 Tax=Rhizobium sp. SSA_523 TaxID=2952477 RepID=UPI00209102D2|nr:sensor histidine kinase [Rhizobium sp. SSA_523]MCO5731349.1 sensor histidine kinase [Rhizobium sp. SSA_523]WKC22121.1 sensor histidine kinase [Rhizobium sp. SSA_523]
MQILVQRFNSLSLARQFLLAGGAVTLLGMLAIGAFVTELIEKAVTRNAAASTALYVDSIIAPVLPDMTTTERLDESVERALDETLGQGALGRRLVAFRLWRGDGTVLYSNDKTLMGQVIPVGEDLRAAFAGQMVSEFEIDDDEHAASAVIGHQPLLEIYNPILQPWSGEVVAVAEFYEVAEGLERDLAEARLKSWLAVALVTLGFYLLLSVIVFRGSRTIDAQKLQLETQIAELRQLLDQNQKLSSRVRQAAQRAVDLNERFLRRIAADLHDGPAQLIGYASLRIDSKSITDVTVPAADRGREVQLIKSSLDEAMGEIRNICQGLVLPEIEALSTEQVIRRVVQGHERRTGCPVALELEGSRADLPLGVKICLYRFVQEGLHNSWRHAGGRGQSVRQLNQDDTVIVQVGDSGGGFDPSAIGSDSLGLSGLRERIESLGGQLSIETGPRGTVLTMIWKV